MIEINLIPKVKRELLRARTIRNRVISVSFLVGGASIAAIVALALIFGGQLAAEVIQDSAIKDKGEELTSVTDIDKVVTIQNQLTKIGAQHESKKINSRLFDVILAVNPAVPNNVSFSSVKLSPEDKTITLEGTAANGYVSLEALKKTILNTKIRVSDGDDSTEVSLTDTIQDGDTGFGDDAEGNKVLQFSFSFVYPEELFTAKGVVSIVTATKKIDVTDSRISVPDSLFKNNSDSSSSDKEDK